MLHKFLFPFWQEVENFKKLNFISKEEFESLIPEAIIGSNQEVPPNPLSSQQGIVLKKVVFKLGCMYSKLLYSGASGMKWSADRDIAQGRPKCIHILQWRLFYFLEIGRDSIE